MPILLIVALAGFGASLVDGTLGMGFGPTSSTILLAAGLAPAVVSTMVNLAKVATGIAAGAAHWRFGNIDRGLVVRLAAPGCVGALVGVTVLANVDGDRLRPYLAVMLLVVGVRILVRYSRRTPTVLDPEDGEHRDPAEATYARKGIAVAALAGGVTNGLIGAWGPVVTPVLLHREGLEPRVAIGSANTAEIAVALTASGSLLASLGGAGVEAGTLVAMLLGGVVAAPVAAWFVRRMPARLLGVGAGTLLVLTNVRDLSGMAGIGAARWAIYAVVVAGCVAAALRPRLTARPARASAPAAA